MASSVGLVERSDSRGAGRIVHRRQVVVDQRVAVDAFEGCAGQQRRRRAACRTAPRSRPPGTAAAACRRRGCNSAWHRAAASGRMISSSSVAVRQLFGRGRLRYPQRSGPAAWRTLQYRSSLRIAPGRISAGQSLMRCGAHQFRSLRRNAREKCWKNRRIISRTSGGAGLILRAVRERSRISRKPSFCASSEFYC